jgi:hypothetical protein
MKRWQAKVFVVVAGIIIGLVLAEAGLRILGIEYPNFYDYDPHLGNKLRAGVKGYFLAEGRGYVSINSDGLRDREHPVSHPPNTLRVAVLGDSYAEAMQVNREEAFWAIMAKELQGCDNLRGRDVEVINFGQSGFGTTQELLALRHLVWKYTPDVVLLAFTTGNDVSDNSRSLKQIDYHPYHVYQGNELILDDQRTKENWLEKKAGFWRQVIYPWKLDTLRVIQLSHQCKTVFWKWWLLQDFGGRSNVSMKGQEGGISETIYREPTTKEWQEAWRVTEGVLVRMRDEIAQKRAHFVVVVLTNGVQVNPDVAVRKAFARSLGVKDLFYPDRRVERFCQSHGIPVLLLGPYFQKYATQHHVFFHGFGDNLGTGHWNQNGHRLAGQIIAKWLCPQLN